MNKLTKYRVRKTDSMSPELHTVNVRYWHKADFEYFLTYLTPVYSLFFLLVIPVND